MKDRLRCTDYPEYDDVVGFDMGTFGRYLVRAFHFVISKAGQMAWKTCALQPRNSF